MANAAAARAANDRSMFQLLIDSIGMTFVAVLCAITGLVHGDGGWPSLEQVHTVLLYGILVAPYFYNREASVEDNASAQDRNDKAVFFPVVAFVLLAIFSGWIGWEKVAPHRMWGTSANVYMDGLVAATVFALAPFAFLATTAHIMLGRGDDSAAKERLFKNKVLLPAFATCLVSFSYGWALSQPNLSAGVACVGLTALLVIVLKLITVKRDVHLGWIVTVIFIALMFTFAYVLIHDSGNRTLYPERCDFRCR
jgi:hypothetical protein